MNTAFPPTSRTNSNAKAIAGTNKILEWCLLLFYHDGFNANLSWWIKAKTNKQSPIIKFYHYELNADDTKSRSFLSWWIWCWCLMWMLIIRVYSEIDTKSKTNTIVDKDNLFVSILLTTIFKTTDIYTGCFFNWYPP